MQILFDIGLLIGGLALVLFFAEQLVKGAVGTAIHSGISAFLISVIFIGFDPDNLFVGSTASYEGVAGFAVGSIIGAVMVALAFAFGISALFAPMRFTHVSKHVLTIPLVSVLFFAYVAFDGELSRIDGTLLLAAYVVSILGMWFLGKRGQTVQATGEVAKVLGKKRLPDTWKSVGLVALSTIAIVAGSEMLVEGAQSLVGRFGLSATFIGMTVLAFLVSIEELARELPAALKGHPDISFGNVVGSVLAMFLFNAGVIAIVSPVPIPNIVLWFYLPYTFGTVVIVSLFLVQRTLPRWGGAFLVLLYAGFIAGSYILS